MGLVDVYRNIGKDVYTYGTFDESGNAKSPAESFADDVVSHRGREQDPQQVPC